MAISSEPPPAKNEAPPGKFFAGSLATIRRLFRARLRLDFVLAIIVVVLVPYAFRYFNPLKVDTAGYTNSDKLEIQELITKVEHELAQTEEARIKRGDAPVFYLRDFDLEVSFVVRASSGQSGSARFEVLTVDNNIQTGLERVQKLTLHMTTTPPPTKEGGNKAASSRLSPQPGQSIVKVQPH